MYAELTALGIHLKRTSGQEKTLCPKCSHTRTKKNEPCLSVNIDLGLFNCKHCTFRGSVDKRYKLPKPVPTITHADTPGIYKHFENRLIEAQTVDHFQIGSCKESFYGEEPEPAIAFKYYLDGLHVNTKYKTKDKKFKMAYGARLIPYNIDSVTEDYVIICEGEEETMVWHQSGYTSVISTPNGAATQNNNLLWLDAIYNRLKGKKIYLATDNDEPGRKLREDISRRFDPENVYFIDYPAKDANDSLREGYALDKIFESAYPMPMEEIIELDEYEAEIRKVLIEGYPPNPSLHIGRLDDYFSMHTKDLVTITGVPGSGKSTLYNYLQVRASMLHDWKFAMFCTENLVVESTIRLMTQILQKPPSDATEAEYLKAFYFVRDHFKFINIEKLPDYSVDRILSIAKVMVHRYGIKGLYIDPFNYLELKQDDTRAEAIGSTLRLLKKFGIQHDVQIAVVAHPSKMEKGANGEYKPVKMYDISGTAHWANASDFILATHRNYQSTEVTIAILKCKYKWRGQIGEVVVEFNPITESYTDFGEPVRQEVQLDMEIFE